MRPLILSPLFASVEGLPFVGSKIAARLRAFGKERVLDLLWSFPQHLEKRTFYRDIEKSRTKELVICEMQVLSHVPPFKKSHPYRVLCQQADNLLELVFFHAPKPYLEQTFPAGEGMLVSGVLEKTAKGFQIVHPQIVKNTQPDALHEEILPVYGLTAGISQTLYRKIVREALQRLPDLPEWLPAELLDKRGWRSWKEAMKVVHEGGQETDLLPHAPCRERLAFDEFLAYQLKLTLFRHSAEQKPGLIFEGTGELYQKVLSRLPFELTEGQQNILAVLTDDLKKPLAMRRLLQGDVGSGKTIVALLAMLQVIESGGQCAFLAPTEILAEQHYETMISFLKNLNVTVGLLLGKTSKRNKDRILMDLKEGKISIIIGTHALLEDPILFPRLGFVVIDEQHRFGVEQRQRLIHKAEGVNVLMMSATPIPRSLALTLYGDLDISLLKEKPKDRLPIQTKVLSLERLPDVHEAVKRALGEGQKIYWVCPLIEESETLDLGHAEARVKILKDLLGTEKVSWIHGRMTHAEKENAIYEFKEGRCSVLVATTVIEVGVHIPQATIMIIEHAERFGLAQLHQLRGRVGRGAHPSTCLLLYGKNLSAFAKKRLEIMRATEDGFIIAEEDLKLRGSGDVLGTKQSGLPDFKVASLESHGHLLPEACALAEKLAKDGDRMGPPLLILLGLFQHSALPTRGS
jgi:ATP-dependent DNA helicase RecG